MIPRWAGPVSGIIFVAAILGCNAIVGNEDIQYEDKGSSSSSSGHSSSGSSTSSSSGESSTSSSSGDGSSSGFSSSGASSGFTSSSGSTGGTSSSSSGDVGDGGTGFSDAEFVQD